MPKTDDIPRGQLSTIILKTLLDNDKYGYEIINDVAEQTNGKIAIKQPSLYSCLRRMEEQSLISSYWRDSSLGGRRHYYRITDYGKKYVEKWQTDILTPSQPESENKTKDKPVFLEQENLFQQSSKVEQQTNSELEPPVDNSFVQYDLFTQSNFIAKPSVEVFETIKDKQHDENIVEATLPQDLPQDNNLDDRITRLRNTILEDNQKTPANDFEPINVKQEFLLLKKKQKSFTESYKEDIISDDGKILDSDLDLKLRQPIVKEEAPISETIYSSNNFIASHNNDTQQERNSYSEEINQNSEPTKSLINIEETDSVEHSESITIEESQPPVFVDLDEEVPTIFKTTTEYKDPEELENINVQSISSTETKEPSEPLVTFEQPKSVEDSKLIEQENLTKTKPDFPKDDGVFITEKTDPENAPKVKRIAPNRFEHFNNYNQSDDLITKLYEKKQEQNFYEEQLVQEHVEPVEEDNLSNEVVENSNIVNYTNFKQLALYYKQNGINFSSYKKLPKALKSQIRHMLKLINLIC